MRRLLWNGGVSPPPRNWIVFHRHSGGTLQIDDSSYKARFYGAGKLESDAELILGPNITDWPEQIALPENPLLTVAAAPTIL